MDTHQKNNLLNEIRELEQNLYEKKSQLRAWEVQEDTGNMEFNKLDKNEWKKIFKELIEKISQLSAGGNSVEDINRERER